MEISGILKKSENRIGQRSIERIEQPQPSNNQDFGAMILTVEFSKSMSEIIEQAMKIHREAMNFSDKAQVAQIERVDESKVLDFIRRAFELEEKAAMLLRNEKEDLVTRAVLFRGAAVLALDCNKLSEAEKLIELGLSGEVPPQIADELRNLKKRIKSNRCTGSHESQKATLRN